MAAAPVKARSASCEARQHEDQMLCACGVSWDVVDTDPPDCRRLRHVSPIPNDRRELLIGARREELKRESLTPAVPSVLKMIPLELSDEVAIEMARAAWSKRITYQEDAIEGIHAAYRVFLDSLES